MTNTRDASLVLNTDGFPALRQPETFSHVSLQEWAVDAVLNVRQYSDRFVQSRSQGNRPWLGRNWRGVGRVRDRFAAVLARAGHSQAAIDLSWNDVRDVAELEVVADE